MKERDADPLPLRTFPGAKRGSICDRKELRDWVLRNTILVRESRGWKRNDDWKGADRRSRLARRIHRAASVHDERVGTLRSPAPCLRTDLRLQRGKLRVL